MLKKFDNIYKLFISRDDLLFISHYLNYCCEGVSLFNDSEKFFHATYLQRIIFEFLEEEKNGRFCQIIYNK